ncbi:MAG: sugar porter family MFS transporter [Proteobacteria bacterium]|nr:sugar porter family MFS transporter [Pseudomonadota bacterium]
MQIHLDPVSQGDSQSPGTAGVAEKRSYNLWYAAGVAFVASAGGFLFGFDLAIIAGALPFLTRDFGLSPGMAGWAASSAIFGAILGPLLGLWFADAIGRRRTMMLSAMAFLASTIGCFVAPDVGQFAFWRLVGGMGVGLAMISCPIYIAELSPAPLRGVLVNVNQLVGVIGINLAVLVGYFVAEYNGDWRLMFAAQGVPVAILILGLLIVPESPRWLAAKGHRERALQVLARINGAQHAQRELDEIIRDVSASTSGLAEVFKPYCRKPLEASIILMIFSQVNGVNMILLYGPTILHDAGISFGSNAVLSSVPTYLMIFLATLVSFPLIHRFSRRGLVIASTLGMAGGHVLMAALLAAHAPALWVLVPMMIGAGTFTFGLAPLSWIIVSEIFPNRVRSHALAIVCVFLFGSSFVTAWAFPVAMDWLRQRTGTPAGMYLVFAAICTSCAWFTWRRMPETKGLSLDKMSEFWRERSSRSAEAG